MENLGPGGADNSLDSVNGEEGKSLGAKSFPESVVIIEEGCIK